ncbi:MAG: CHAT domain-containing tetratricopeptide repeat protein [Bradyrhizobium sp.]
MPRSARWRLSACALLVVLVLAPNAAMAGLAQQCSALFARGNQLYRKGDYPLATKYLERAAKIAPRAFGPDHPNVSAVYDMLAAAYLAQSRYNDAGPFLLRALQIREHSVGPNSPDLVPILSNTALLYDDQGRYEDAEALYKRVLSIQQASIGPDNPSVAITLGNLANLYQHQGRYGEAEGVYKRALSIVGRAFGSGSPNLVFVIDNLAALYGNEGRCDEATGLLERSLAIKEKALGADNPAVAATLTSIASVYDHEGRFEDAEQLYKRALAISEADRGTANIAAALNNLAAFYRARHRLAEAEPLYRRSLKLQQKAHGPNSPDVATVLSNLAVLDDREGRPAEAEPLYRAALGIDQAALGADSQPAASDMYALGLLYDRLGRATDAGPLLKNALAIREKSRLFNPANVALSLSGLARFYDHQGRVDDALAAARKAVAIWRANGATSWDPNASGRANERMMRHFLPEMVRILFEVYSGASNAPQAILDEAFRAAQSARSTDTAQALAGMTARYASGSDALGALIRQQEDLSARSQALDASLISVLSQPAKARSSAAEAALRAEQGRVETTLKVDDARLRKQFPRFVELARAPAVGIADIQKVLGPNEAFAEMMLDKSDGYLFVVRKDKAAFFKLALTRTQAVDAVKALRVTLVNDTPFPVDKAYDLYSRLFGPADRLIADARSLIIVPDGALESLPPAVLVTTPPQGKDVDYGHVPWLIRRQALTILPAASSLVSLRSLPPAPPATNPFAGFGDPDFHGHGAKRGIDTLSLYKGSEAIAERLRSLPSLPDTANELRAEARMLGAPGSSLHLGDDATVSVVKSLDLSNTRIIAFATHAGIAGEIAGLAEPALVLTPPAHPTPEDDGLLRASQVSQLHLNAEFVILSACNTAASDGTPGAEGLSGLAKAFFYAGARSLLVSNWDVESRPTVKLTTGLIRALAANPGIGRAEALRRSILAMIDDTQDANDRHPIAWAPFVLAGEGGAGR